MVAGAAGFTRKQKKKKKKRMGEGKRKRKKEKNARARAHTQATPQTKTFRKECDIEHAMVDYDPKCFRLSLCSMICLLVVVVVCGVGVDDSGGDGGGVCLCV